MIYAKYPTAPLRLNVKGFLYSSDNNFHFGYTFGIIGTLIAGFVIASIAVGTLSTLILGLGMSCIMVWNDLLFILGIVLGVLGLIGVCAAYPLCQHITKKEKERITPMILELSEELENMSS